MCGICGVFYSDRAQRVNRDMLVAMSQQIVHRGPDDDGFFIEENVGLAMRRLSIIDIQTGHQPISNEDFARQGLLYRELYEAGSPGILFIEGRYYYVGVRLDRKEGETQPTGPASVR